MEEITAANFESSYADPIEMRQIDKFVCQEMGRQIHRYIKAMSGLKTTMDRFEEGIAGLSVPEKEKAIARYIDLNRRVLDGLDLKMVLARAMANYCDTFSYFTEMVNDWHKMSMYLERIKEKYIQFHKVFEQDGKLGIKDHKGGVVLQPRYDFLRTCYAYAGDLCMMPVVAEKDGKMGLVLPDGNDTVVAPFVYDDIALRDEYPFFEASKDGATCLLGNDGSELG